VGRRLLSDASETVLRTSMELGGNAPFVVFEDADLDAAVAGAMLAKLRNMGEACTAANRFIVHESVADEFAEKFAAKMKDMTTARGTEPESKVGPLIDAKSRDKVHELVTDAVSDGATSVVGGVPVDGPGYFYQPTLLKGVTEGPGSCPRRSSAPSPRSSPSAARTRPCGWPTTPNTGWWLTSSPRTSTAASGWAKSSRPACSA
jgi:succinate-semialdehyde dehydrogenase/glutarate-semialdehyde dehydrogenase